MRKPRVLKQYSSLGTPITQPEKRRKLGHKSKNENDAETVQKIS
jgi:hypothetical protein